MIQIILPYLPPPEFSRNSRAHWSVRSKIQQRIDLEIDLLLREAGWTQETPWKYASVDMEFVLPDKRVRDGDNLITAAKPILDSLKGRLFRDDRIRCIGMPNYHYSYGEKKRPQTIIQIEERDSE